MRRARPRNDAVAEIADGAGADGLYLFAHDGKGSALARFFGPSVGVDEDPATGSAAGPLGAYLFAHTGRTGELVIRQGEQLGRPSLLRVEASGDRFAPSVIVSGHVRVVGHGAFEVPWPPAP